MPKGIFITAVYLLFALAVPVASSQIDTSATAQYDSAFGSLISGGVFTGFFILMGILFLMMGFFKSVASEEIAIGPIFLGIMLLGVPMMLRIVFGFGEDLGEAATATASDSEGFDLSTFILAAAIIVGGAGLIIFKLVSDARERTRVDALLERIANERGEEGEQSQDNVPSLNELAAREASSGSGKVISTAEPVAASEPVHKNKRKVILD